MKKKFFIFLIALFFLVSFPVNATERGFASKQEEVIYLENGNYITVTLSEIATRAANTKTGSKTYRYYSSNDEELWRAVLSGTFTYDGISSRCTAATCNVSISDADWYVVTKSATKSGNVATANVEMGLKWLGITVNKESVTIKLSCSSTGVLS